MSEVKNIPRLRFPDFTESWERRKLKEFSTFFSGGTPTSTIKKFYNGNIPFIKSGEINSDETNQFLSEEGLNNSSAKRVDKGDLLYALYGATSGEVGVSKIDGAINQAVLCIRGNFNNILLANYLKKEKNKIVSTYLQGGQGNLSAEIIKNLKLFLPSLPEQQKIEDFLTAADKRIELLEKKKTLLETYKKGVMKKIFNQEIRFKDENGDDFPDWEEKKAMEICEVKVGGTPSTSKPEYWDGEIPWINSGEIKNGIIIEPSRYITDLGLKKTSTYLLPKGTSVLAMTGATLGKMGMLSFSSTANQSVAGFVTDPITSKFIFYNFIYDQKQILSKAGGAAQKGVNKNTIENFDVRIPCLEEQVKISEFLSSIDNQIELLETQIDKSKTWKKGLLQKMFV